eukprot:366442-Chlamydomonas_euryale.AAC.17
MDAPTPKTLALAPLRSASAQTLVKRTTPFPKYKNGRVCLCAAGVRAGAQCRADRPQPVWHLPRDVREANQGARRPAAQEPQGVGGWVRQRWWAVAGVADAGGPAEAGQP